MCSSRSKLLVLVPPGAPVGPCEKQDLAPWDLENFPKISNPIDVASVDCGLILHAMTFTFSGKVSKNLTNILFYINFKI